MKYEAVDSISREQAEALEQSGELEALASAILSIALSDPDVEWATAFCLRLAMHEDEAARASALLGLGHLARRFRTFPDASRVAGALERGLHDPSTFVRQQADAAADDFEQFVGPLRRQ